MEEHNIICDKCGKISKMEKYISYCSPEGWKYIDNKDLCPKCYKKLKKFINTKWE